jgi:hypothetical protein
MSLSRICSSDAAPLAAVSSASWPPVSEKKVTTVFPRQGHYAVDPKILAKYPPADISVERIGDLLNYNLELLLAVHNS